ncbi:hypothetical protein GCM10007906_28080 [Vibrio hyugaensis]|uniref:DUF6998 domain-containing protein n=1 Tax=Vibrio hyugaensis TaxID=1534743 RepID=A0ABQ5Y7Y1_9VIBR|nr:MULTISPECIES: hypothetical protein [Vibrio]GLR05220.1 hypothetical protein GCM10007906_28080 [Vibrio hyugaensis]
MDYKVFIDNDAEYLKWVELNETGFVVNTTRTKRKAYRVLHKASCRHVTTRQSWQGDGAFTSRDYIKICAPTIDSLRAWTRAEGESSGQFSQECASCKPWLSESYTEVSSASGGLSLENVKDLHDKYLELIKFEVEQLGVKPTEARHLIGRLGEFYCALTVNGTISHVVNQHGFDVLAQDGRRISVKTTAQKSGFVRISEKTLDKVDDLMVIQYANGRLDEVYFGNIQLAISHARYYDNLKAYELDISKARALSSAQVVATEI